jgi:hypothetical protein
VDAAAWPGTPAAAWPPAVPGKPFDPPSGRGTRRLIGTGDTGRCPSCGRAVRLRFDGRIIAHKNQPGHCPGSGEQPADDLSLACWLPVKDGLTPHGLRHSHKTWMTEDGIPEILAEQRLGHQIPGMRGLYAHASPSMRDEPTPGGSGARCPARPRPSSRTGSKRCTVMSKQAYGRNRTTRSGAPPKIGSSKAFTAGHPRRSRRTRTFSRRSWPRSVACDCAN